MTSRRLTVQEAAEVLGTSVDAVRMRVRRGSLTSEKDSDGREYVWVDGNSSETKLRPDGESVALISAKNETIRVLEEQLRLRAEEIQRRDVIISQLTRANSALAARVPELESPGSREEPTQGATDGAARVGYPAGDTGDSHSYDRPRDTAEFPVGGSLIRPWWRRVFGG
jgi:excisionase family DNA binding protein